LLRWLTKALALFYVIQLQRLDRCAKDVLSSEGKERLPRPKPYLLRELDKALALFMYFSKEAGFPADIYYIIAMNPDFTFIALQDDWAFIFFR
jgi:hypothetical protein